METMWVPIRFGFKHLDHGSCEWYAKCSDWSEFRTDDTVHWFAEAKYNSGVIKDIERARGWNTPDNDWYVLCVANGVFDPDDIVVYLDEYWKGTPHPVIKKYDTEVRWYKKVSGFMDVEFSFNGKKVYGDMPFIDYPFTGVVG